MAEGEKDPLAFLRDVQERGEAARKIRRFLVTVNKGMKPGIGLAVIGEETDLWVQQTPAVEDAMKASFREISVSPGKLRYTKEGARHVAAAVKKHLEAAFPEERFVVAVEGDEPS